MSNFIRFLDFLAGFFAIGARTRFGRATLYAICAAPPIYVLTMMMWGGLQYPFWDHVGTARYILRDHAGELTWQDYFTPHNEHIMAIPRWITVQLARLTGWSQGPEFTVMYCALLATYGIVARFIWRAARTANAIMPIVPLVLTALILFSPAGHNNLWWSFMLQLVLTALFSYAAFYTLADQKGRFSRVLGAALLAWAATFCMANGVVTFLALSAVAAIELRFGHRPFRNRVRDFLFLSINAGAAYAVVAGLGQSSSQQTFLPFKLIEFLLVYAGTPAGSLIDFSYNNMFEYPTNSGLSLFMGALVILMSGGAVLASLKPLAAGDRRVIFPIACIAFGIGTGLIIGMGRITPDGAGMELAGASRYTIYSAFIYIGIFARLALMAIPRMALPPRVPAIATAYWLIFLAGCSMVAGAYSDGSRMFRESGNFNIQLGQAYALDDRAADHYGKMFPDSQTAENIKLGLIRARLGPYRALSEERVPHAESISAPLVPLILEEGVSVSQRISFEGTGAICGVEYQIATWGQQLSGGQVGWQALFGDASPQDGVIELDGLGDWSAINVPVTALSDFSLTLTLAANPSSPIALPLREYLAATEEHADAHHVDGRAPSNLSFPHTILLCR